MNMKSFHHAKISVKKYGGSVDDYIEIHTFIDSPKVAYSDVRHRAILHSSYGCFVAELVFGYYITNSDGKDVAVRDLVEEHILQDLGFIPSVEHWLSKLPIEDWMFGTNKKGLEVAVESNKPTVTIVPGVIQGSPVVITPSSPIEVTDPETIRKFNEQRIADYVKIVNPNPIDYWPRKDISVD
jgi:hypothetical protein